MKNIEIPNLAMRKARKLSDLQIDEKNESVSTSNKIEENVLNETKTSIDSSKKLENIKFSHELSDEELLKMAKSRGLAVKENKVFIKHTFSITPETKKEFKKTCMKRGISMQDGMEEALNDWFRK